MRDKLLTGLLIGMALIALGLGWAVRRAEPAATVAPPPGGERGGLPIPADQVGSPYMPWPVSFPKLLPGLFMLEDQAPALRLSREQAGKLLPVVEEMGRRWQVVHSVEIKMRNQLTPEQRAWITRVKHQVEMSTLIEPVVKTAGQIPPGENASVHVALAICERRSARPVPAEVAAAAEAERHRVLAPREYEQRPGEEWLTVFDQATALFFIDRDHPELALGPRQAAFLRAIMLEVVDPLKVVSKNEERLRGYLTPEQIRYVQTHMADLYKYRTGQIKPHGADLTFPGNAVSEDADKFHDPLYYETVKFLRGRVTSSAPAGG